MANDAQRLVATHIGDGGANRLDYSTRRIGSLPTTHSEGLRFIHAGNNAGPGSDAYNDLMAAYAAGWDLESLPDNSGGGIHRSIDETAALIDRPGSRAYFREADPLLHRLHLGDGRSLADAGPDAAREGLALAMADASSPEERRAVLQALDAINNSRTSSLSISFEAPEPHLTWEAPTAAPRSIDPYTNWRNGQERQGLQRLAIETADDTFDGMSGMGSGGGTYDPWTAGEMAEIRRSGGA